MVWQLLIPILLFIWFSSTNFSLDVFPDCLLQTLIVLKECLTNTCLVRYFLNKMEPNCSLFQLEFYILDPFFDRQITSSIWMDIINVLFNFFEIVFFTMFTDIIYYNMIRWVYWNISPLIKTVEHKKHVVHSLYCSVSYAMRCIWHHTQNQWAKPLWWIIKLETKALNCFNIDVFVRSCCLWIIETWGVYQRHST